MIVHDSDEAKVPEERNDVTFGTALADSDLSVDESAMGQPYSTEEDIEEHKGMPLEAPEVVNLPLEDIHTPPNEDLQENGSKHFLCN